MQEWFLPNAHRTVAAGVGAGLDDFKGFIPLGMGKGATGATGGGTGTFGERSVKHRCQKAN